MLRPNTKDRILTGEALLHPFFSKPGDYYESTIITRSDEEESESQEKDAEEEKKKAQLDSENSFKLCDTLDARLKQITLSEAPTLKKEHILTRSTPTSPSIHLAGMDNSLKVPIASPLSSFHSTVYSIEDDKEEGESSKKNLDVSDRNELRDQSLHCDTYFKIGNQKCATPTKLDAQVIYDVPISPRSPQPSGLVKQGSNEEIMSSGEEQRKMSHEEESKKQKRQRPQTFHESMFRSKGALSSQERGHGLHHKRLPAASLTRKIEEKNQYPWYHEVPSEAKQGYEIIANKIAMDDVLKGWTARKVVPAPSPPRRQESEAESLDHDLQSVAGKANEIQMELQQYHDGRSSSRPFSESSAPSEEETEELAARLDEMGILAANLTRMVEESKNKLSLIKETKMTRSASSFHRADRSYTSTRKPSTSHNRQYSTDEYEQGNCSLSAHSQSHYAGKSQIPATPSSTSKSKAMAALKSGSLRRKISLTHWARKDSISSPIPFPSENAVEDQGQYCEEMRVGKETPSREDREQWMTSPRGEGQSGSVSRSHLSRINSGRGRALSHFLTRYGSRSTKSAFNSSSEVAEDGKIEANSTLNDKSSSSESLYRNLVGPGKSKAPTLGISPSEGKQFFDDEGVVNIGSSEDNRQHRNLPKESIEQSKVKSPIRISQYANTPAVTNRRLSRVGQSPTVIDQPLMDHSAKRPVMSGDTMKSPSGKSINNNAPPVTLTTSVQRGRTLSNMKSFTLGRSNSSKMQNRQENLQSPRSGQAESRHKRELTVDTTIRPVIRNEAIESSSPRHSTKLLPMTPLIGEDPPRHSVRSRDSSSHSNQSHNNNNSPSASGGGGLWNRLFRANTSNTPSRLQSPRPN